MAWVYLVLAILAEVAGAISMKLAEGYTRLIPSISTAFFYVLSLGLLALIVAGVVGLNLGGGVH